MFKSNVHFGNMWIRLPFSVLHQGQISIMDSFILWSLSGIGSVYNVHLQSLCQLLYEKVSASSQ